MQYDKIPISKFSRLTGLTAKALRYYDEKGLLVPEAKDTITGYRYYTATQIDVGVKIMTLQSLGFSVEDMKTLIEALENGDTEAFIAAMNKRRSEIKREIARYQSIDALLEKLDPEEIIEMSLSEPTRKTTAPQRVLSKSGRGQVAELINRYTMEIVETVMSPENQQNFVKFSGAFMTIYPTMEHDINDLPVEVAIPVTGRVTVTDPEMELKTIQPFEVLYVVHKGSYESMRDTYGKLMKYAEENGIELTTPFREIYLSNPEETPEDELLTEIQAAIKSN